MRDVNTKQRQEELSGWQRRSLGSIFGDFAPPARSLLADFWRALELGVAWIGCLVIGLVVLALVAAILGLYWEIVAFGFDSGRDSARWFWGIPR